MSLCEIILRLQLNYDTIKSPHCNLSFLSRAGKNLQKISRYYQKYRDISRYFKITRYIEKFDNNFDDTIYGYRTRYIDIFDISIHHQLIRYDHAYLLTFCFSDWLVSRISGLCVIVLLMFYIFHYSRLAGFCYRLAARCIGNTPPTIRVSVVDVCFYFCTVNTLHCSPLVLCDT